VNIAKAFIILALLWLSENARAESKLPYARSKIITGITFDKETWLRRAEGSDIWSCTWAADGSIYAAWGDGGGFGGSDTLGRASLGVARISGIPPQWSATNIWGGVAPVSQQKTTTGKATMIAVSGALYLYASEQGEWDRCRLWKSGDAGVTWEDRGWIFPKSHKVFAFPGFIQFGQDNGLSPDGFVYGFSDNDPRRGQDKRLYLFRVKPSQMEVLAAYEYFAGTERHPHWSSNIAKMKPVFSNPAGIGWGTTCVFHPATRRYLLAVSIHERAGDWGLYESEHPWGPWRTVAYNADLPEWTYAPAEKERPTYLHTFPAPWFGEDGRTLWCVFDRGDHFNIARCTLSIKAGR
jgi:hypothetical protein